MLPANFTFNQSSLQAYRDCPRRYWLAYVVQLPWPAVAASPVQEFEARMQQGKQFHRLVERTEIGLAPEQVIEQADKELAELYNAYRQHRPKDLPTETVEVELLLSTSLDLEGANDNLAASTVQLAAKYDLIAAEHDGRAVIVDWKTSKRTPTRAVLQEHMQSLVYPFVLVEASNGLPWGPIRPEQVEMLYWFTAAPASPLVLHYNGEQHDRVRARLRNLVAAMLKGESEEDFPKVEDTPTNRMRFCGFCVYRSRCNRGAAAGDVDEIIDPTDYFTADVPGALDFTMNEVEELAF
jgi:hypothetical protein